jgi:NADH-quinone oxidoreductase subunit L
MDVLEALTLSLVTLVPLLLIIFLITSAYLTRKQPGKLGGYTLAIFGAAWLAALAGLGLVIFNGPVNFPLVQLGQVTILGVLADRLSLIIILLVTTVSGVVHLYSLRAMQEEKRFPRYFMLLSLVTVEVMLVVLSNNLLLLAVFWILKGLTLTFLLAHYQERTASWRAAFVKLRIDLIGAGAFILAVILTWNIFGTFEIQAINNIAAQAPQNLPADRLTLLTALLFVAAMAKSAQFPLHSWLPRSVEAPTPVSALMHAGLINAGGFLLIRLSPLFVAAPLTMGLVIVVGSFTAFYGTLIMLTRNDVKGKLVYSTMGQMGFMMLQCGLGAFALATFHIVAHGLFKATLFLSSGSVVQAKALNQHLAPASEPAFEQVSKPRFFLASLLAALLLFLLPPALGFPVNSEMILLAFAWITIIYSLPKLTRLPVALWLGVLTALVVLYLAGTRGIEKFLVPVVAAHPNLDSGLSLAISGVVMVIGLVFLILQMGRRPDWLTRFLNRLYVRVLFSGYGK